MSLQEVFCPYGDCIDKGEVGKGNIVWWQRRRGRCKCQSCGRTFSVRRGNMYYGLRTAEQTVTQVVTLLAYGCPCQAIVAAFGLDARTVLDWQHRAGTHAQQVQAAQQHALNLQQVQADELRIKVQGKVVLWVAMAIMVRTRLWLGAVVSPQRDSALIARLAMLVRRWARPFALFVVFDGFAAYQDAFEKAFSDKVRSKHGRRVNRVWPWLALGQVVKHQADERSGIARYLLRGSPTLVVRLRTLSQGAGTLNTAFIERLNGTFRTFLAPLARCTHHLARATATLDDAVALFGVVYNFCRPHASLRGASPAMAAQLTDHLWSVADLLTFRPNPFFDLSTVSC